jgi:hypothetical protein
MTAEQKDDPEFETLLRTVPPFCRERFTDIVALTDDFCDRFLNGEYRTVCREIAASFCQEGEVVLPGKAEGWACGLVYAAGKVNLLADPSHEPCVRPEQIAESFGVSPTTMYLRGSLIWDGLELTPFDPDFTVPGMANHRPHEDRE